VVRFLAGTSVQTTGTDAHVASYSMGKRDSFYRDKTAGGVNLSTYLYLVPRLRTTKLYLHFPIRLHAMHSDFTFILRNKIKYYTKNFYSRFLESLNTSENIAPERYKYFNMIWDLAFNRGGLNSTEVSRCRTFE
jgi:hypothetical protein